MLGSELRGSLVALITPFDAQQQVDYASLEKLVDFHLKSGTHGLVVMGTTGESATLSTEEHLDVVRAVIKQVDGRLPVIGGCGSNNTAQAIYLSQQLHEMGATAGLSATPYYNKPTQDGLLQHYRAIADASPLPQLLYNVPGRTCCDLLPETVARLANVDNIIGIKDATGSLERLLGLQAVCPEEFLLLSGDDFSASAFMLSGGHGVISVTSNLAPKQMARMCEHALEGDAVGATRLNRSLYPLHSALFAETSPIPAKWGAYRMGLIAEPAMRLPLCSLTAKGQHTMTAALQGLSLID